MGKAVIIQNKKGTGAQREGEGGGRSLHSMHKQTQLRGKKLRGAGQENKCSWRVRQRNEIQQVGEGST